MSSPERLQKLLASAGVGSRREIEQWIKEGRIKVNRITATLGDKATPQDRVTLNGKPLRLSNVEYIKHRVLIYHKPIGEVCTRTDPENRPSVFEKLPQLRQGRWIMVGRLDINTCGLLLFTTDGELANRLMHPSYQVEREYAVRVLGEVTKETLDALRKGVTLNDGPAAFDSIVDAGGTGANHWYHVTLHEGRNREVKRLWESQGVVVSRLMRVRFGEIQLPRLLRPGTFRDLDETEMRSLYRNVELKVQG